MRGMKTMKNLKRLVFAFIAATFMVSGVSLAKVSRDNARPSGTDPVPWPWGAEAPFPWTFVQGTWLAENETVRTYFTFRVIRSKSGINQLEVQEVNPSNCEVIARGVGYEQNRVVRAQMVSFNGGAVYRLSLRSFSAQAIQSRVAVKPVNGQYVVLSVVPFEASPNSVSIPMTQISSRLTIKCSGN